MKSRAAIDFATDVSQRCDATVSFFCRAVWLHGIPAQLTAMMDGAPAPAPPGCELAQKSHIHVWNSTILLPSSSHLTSYTKTSTTSKVCFDFQICSYLFLQSRKPSHCTAGSPWQGQTLTHRLDPLLACKARGLNSSIAWDREEG